MYLIAYVPVLHEGYTALFRAYADHTLVLVSPEYVSVSLPRLGRDLRHLPVEEMRRAIVGLDMLQGVEIASDTLLSQINTERAVVRMPRDEVSDVIAKKIPDCTITYENVFLRWDKPITLAEQTISPDHKITSDEFDKECMQNAQQEAERSSDWWRQVGVIAARDGNVLFTGFNKHHPSEHSVYVVGNPRDNFDAGEHLEISDTLHGEAGIVARAARSVLNGASIYVTTFPCINCARLLAEAGVKRVYYRDGYSRLDAETVLKDHGIEIIRVNPD